MRLIMPYSSQWKKRMEDNFSPQQSLQLIENMIKKVRSDISENRFYFLMWGWITFLALLTQFVLKVVVNYPHHYLVWLCVIPAVILTIVRSNRPRGRSVRTYVGDSMKFLWMGIGISFFVLCFVITNTRGGWYIAYPFFILFYGLGTFVSGMFLKFRPLIIGGVFNWLLACVCVLLPYDYQLLVSAAAILTSYIIPGHIIQKPIADTHGRKTVE
ncbi:MAG: hypothetical protein EOO14_14520 [Chitinophagaceae bacterium]|nr:MAG: hypothetical protein EOO14_14520 [Chitinophagaceae bacterium]